MGEHGGEPPCLMNQLDEEGQVLQRPEVEGGELEGKTAAARPDGEPSEKQAQP